MDTDAPPLSPTHGSDTLPSAERAFVTNDDDSATATAVVAAAQRIAERLLAEAAESESRGHYSVEAHEEMLAAGLYTITVPRMFGGSQLPLPVHTRVVIELAKGDGGSAWCFSLAAGHSITATAFWPESVQAELFAADGNFLAPHQFAHGGSVVPGERDGMPGLIVNGTYPFSSGIPFSTHLMVNSPVTDGELAPYDVTFVVPRSDYAILDNWSGAFGMKASGSNAAVLTDVFVPMERVYDYGRAQPSASSHGTELHGSSMYLGGLDAYHPAGIAAVIVGEARGALREFEEIMGRSKSGRSASSKLHDADFQQTFGLALELVDSAEALVMSSVSAYLSACEAAVTTGVPLASDQVRRIGGLGQSGGRFAAEAIDMLFAHVGSLHVIDGTRMQRIQRNALMYRTHGRMQQRANAAGIARSYWGIAEPA
ncbi:acyl-CoA dehydrogenase family protein [Subtercola frigoramans]|uniref:3-hydroxy-9,10-secoandrosta-1,3,5(10)-triene-9, 17-dione monooxygenase n=1 Tax=Subtercola frigoramans TaxID=120298 RepID=A0ABS2LAB1_9MICO|nr:acyl-CoA dehydrogenase family protein [Subtercola frigoramans]MBM7473690.1 3-hydroxy-9,10-secoandrosta-1,3,5(10)-triene-9,17-dione monooxygenase [Subtercola frigoramans]